MRKSIVTYRDLSKLLVLTKRIEHLLEHQGGSGKGMWEKAKSIEENLYEGMLHEIFLIADVRNKAIHHSPQIANIDEVVSNAKKIIKKLYVLDVKKRFDAKTSYGRVITITGFLIKATLLLITLYTGCAFLYEEGKIGGLLLCIPLAFIVLKFFEKIPDKWFLYLIPPLLFAWIIMKKVI